MSKPKPPTVQDFFKRFPTDHACLDHLMELRFGKRRTCSKCGKDSTFHKRAKRPAYECANCGYDINPMVGTPFERTRTPLQKWFYAIYLFTTTRHGVPAKELQRQLSVTYKTAWRMGHELRKYMAYVDGDSSLGGPTGGVVEIDETRIGGKDVKGKDDKTVVMGMLERQGELITRVVPNVRRKTLYRYILAHVRKGSRVATDELGSYKTLRFKGYRHASVAHRRDEYVRGEVHVNSIEGFWSLLQRSIRGTHVHVSAKHLPKYVGEFEYRHNLRDAPHLMFEFLVMAFPRPARKRVTVANNKI